MRRIISLWLPHLAIDRLTRRGAAFAAWRGAVATVTTAQGGLRVAAASPAAQAAGIQSGRALADARALLPDLKTVPAAPADDLACLAALAEWCGRYTPWTAPDGLDPDGGGGVMLDVSGCAHLFGGEEALLDDLLGRLDKAGFAAAAALADTPAAAWAACRFGRDGARRVVVPEGAARQLLAGLPMAALRLPPAAVETLHRLGLRRIGDLHGLPRAPLAARFGEVVARRLDQLLGLAPEPVSPVRPATPHHARLAFAEPIARTEDVAAALRHLLETLCAGLAQQRLGARRLALVFYRVDASLARLEIGTAQPVRAPVHLERLFARGLDGLDAGFGFEAASLAATAVEPLDAAQLDMTDRRRDAAAGDDVGLLVDRLGNRLGRGSVVRLARRASHLPERAVQPAPPLPARDHPAPALPPRPSRLLARPERIEAQAEAGPPVTFRWRNEDVRVVRAEGPERIAAEWWHAATPPPPGAMRDYWRIEDGAGRRFWLYRDGARGPWFVHGVFA